MNKTNWILSLVAVAVLAFVGGYITGNSGSDEDVEPISADKLAKFPEAAPGAENCPFKGPDHAKVTIVEFTDFQCPFCSRVVPTMEELLEKYEGDLKVHVCMNPLAFHKRAFPAAIAYLAANRQGKGMEMHNVLFENKDSLEDDDLKFYAKEMGLDMAKFETDIADKELEAQVKAMQVTATALGASGTPAFFINGEFLSGAQPVDKFSAVIDKQLERAAKLEKRDVPVEKMHAILSWKAMEGKYRNFIFEGKKAEVPKEKPPFEKRVRNIPIGDSPRHGTGEEIIIAEFSEFQCPFCSRVAPLPKEVVAHYGNRASLVFKHFPLGFHDNAMNAALASLAAGNQGKFWEMHDILFQNQKALQLDKLMAYAAQLGLDMEKFKADMESDALKARVDEDMKLAKRSGVGGTPTLFVNGRKYDGPREADKMIELIDKEILKK